MRMTITNTDAPLTMGLNTATILAVAFVVLALLAAPFVGPVAPQTQGVAVTQD